MLKQRTFPGSVSLSGSVLKVNQVYSGFRLNLHLSLVEMCSVDFV